MPFMPPSLRRLLFGTPFGEVFPPRSPPKPLSTDGRTAALHVLRDYVTNLTFYRAMAQGQPPQAFQIDPANFHIEWPDSTVDMVAPSISVIHSRGRYDTIGLVSYVEEDTRDVYGQGTVLQWQMEYIETINLEINVSKKSERRAIIAGLEIAFSPTEQMSGLRFTMPEYFDELVCFVINKRELMDDGDSARNRRRAQIEIEMRHNIVALVNYVQIVPSLEVNVDIDQGTGIAVDLSQDPNARTRGDLSDAISQNLTTTSTTPNPVFRS